MRDLEREHQESVLAMRGLINAGLFVMVFWTVILVTAKAVIDAFA